MQPYKVIDRVENELATVECCSDQIIRVSIKPGVELDGAAVKKLYGIYKQISKDKPYAYIFLTEDGTSSLTFDGRKFAAQNPDYYKKICVALIVKSLPQRIIGNFYFKTLERSPVPYRLFKTLKDAEAWCHQVVEKAFKITH